MKGGKDAFILLSNCHNCNGYLIGIGISANSQSFLSEDKQRTGEQLLNTPNYLSATEWSTFWISYTYQANSVTIA